MAAATSLVETLAQTALFADLPRPQLEAVVHEFDEEVFAAGQRVLRTGLSGSGLYIIVDGEAIVNHRGGAELARLGRGEFFGEVSVFSGEAPAADVTAATMLRCLVVPRPEVERFLLERPQVMLRMLRIVSLRLGSVLGS
jgi:CRP/FNR family transcriptional regulator, cyclic AMP receptor protein